jgi:carbon-monoxide dehydrogenase medium subunit
VIPAEFDYVAPDTLDEALSALSQSRPPGEDAKLLAGGHSLLPLMKLRLAAPTLLVDLRKVPGLSGISSERSGGEASGRDSGGVTIGAMTTHTAIANADLGLIAEVSSTIADPQVRNRGTLGGSLAHGDPASDQPAILLAYEGSVTVRGPGGERTIAAADLFEDYLTTAVGDDEVVTSVNYPALDGYGFGYQKFNRRKEDWAMVAVSALVKKASDGSCEDVRIGLTHMSNVPLRATAAEEALRGGALDAAAIAAAAELAAEGTSPPGDLNASPDYKRHLARVLCRRALEDAAA